MTWVVEPVALHPSIVQEFKIQNIVGSCDVKFPIRLEGLCMAHGYFATVSQQRDGLSEGLAAGRRGCAAGAWPPVVLMSVTALHTRRCEARGGVLQQPFLPAAVSCCCCCSMSLSCSLA